MNNMSSGGHSRAQDSREMRSAFDDREAPAHVLAIPHESPGHITPMFRFTSQLARDGITVSFVCFEDTVIRLTSSSLGTDALLGLQSTNFRFVTLQKPPIERPSRAQMLKDVFDPFLQQLTDAKNIKDGIGPLMEKLTKDKNKNARRDDPTCIVSDMLLSWPSDMAEKLQIPHYVMVSSGVVYARYLQGAVSYLERGVFPISEADGKRVEFDWSLCISGLPPMRCHELLCMIGRDLSEQRMVTEVAKSLVNSTGVLVNSFFELEEKVVEAFRNPKNPGDECNGKAPKIYPIGPLFLTSNFTDATNAFGLEDSSSRCIRWLASQPSSSVLYIAFGSVTRLRPEQVQELAYGLEASNQRFLWVCPLKKVSLSAEKESPSAITEVLPPGFEARVGDRGCIVTGWAPQLQILAHTSTGGFLSHCGWNSTLESCVFGMPMIAWPQGAEQNLNCRYVVDDLKIAEQLQTGKENIVKRNEVERAVRLLMVESEGKAMRTRAEELKKKAASAMAEGGSQSKFFHEFLDDIRPL